MNRIFHLARPRSAAICAAIIASACALVLPATAFAAAQASNEDPSVDWDLGDLYPNGDAWSAALAKARESAVTLEQWKGTLGKDAASMYRAMAAISDLRREGTRIFVYASLQGDEDLRVQPAQERRQQAQALQTMLDEKTAWLAPEVIAVGAEKVDAFLAQNADLKRRFDFSLHDILRNTPHTLSPEGEGVLASAGDLLSQPDNVYQQLNGSDIPWPSLDMDGKKVRLDQSAYTKYRTSDSRAERKAVFDAFWGTWKGYESTLGTNMATQVMGDMFTSKSRKFGSSLEAATFADNMPADVYRTLVAQTNASLPTLHRYLRMRKKLLGITDDLAYYDNYPSLFPSKSIPKFDVADSERITLAALAPMGDEYLSLMKKGFAGKWMNALPHPGKASGAYMNGSAYDVHPYLLLNHNDNYDSLSTLAHEWGHAVHTLLTAKAQPYEKSNYSTFIAESASIGNEMLLNDFMVANAKSKEEKLYYLGQGLESIRTTYFRQTMFAEFQLQMHKEMEEGRPLSGRRLTEMYCSLLRHYYGEAEGVMKIDPTYCTEWEFIPHFYYGFYVYQYATSMAGAAEFTDAIIKEGKPARDRFLTMLKAGGSGYPYDLYKRAGLDMASPAPYQALVARMNRIMDEIEVTMSAKAH